MVATLTSFSVFAKKTDSESNSEIVSYHNNRVLVSTALLFIDIDIDIYC